MYKVGVFVGKFCPMHKGHVNAILQASTKCEKLYVVVSHDKKLDEELFKNSPVKPISFEKKMKWASEEFSDLDFIQVIGLDETYIPSYPEGWQMWSKLLRDAVPEKFDVIFGGEPQYADEGYTKYYPEVKYELYDTDRKLFPISATMIRDNPYENWEYLVGASRPYFAKKVLIAGSESCGKSSLTKMLAKIFNTSWAREEGRYYSSKYFGGNEDLFELEDFYNICLEQREIEDKALRTANKVAFFDTDATITQFYCDMYLGEYNPRIEHMIDSERYDIILMMKPDVRWVDDGFRWNSDDRKRWKLHEEVKQMYIDRGMGHKIIEVGGTYNERLNESIDIVNKLLSRI